MDTVVAHATLPGVARGAEVADMQPPTNKKPLISDRPLIAVNLTNGLFYPGMMTSIIPDMFVRLPSTFCEQTLWDEFIMSIDANFLLHYAMGREIHLYDTSSRRGWLSGAQSRGLVIMDHAFKRSCGMPPCKTEWPLGAKVKQIQSYPEEVYRKLKESTRARLKYFRKYHVPGTPVGKVVCFCCPVKEPSDNVSMASAILRREM